MDNKRIPLIDELRGLAIVGMVIYHFLYSLFYIFGVNIGSQTIRIMELVQPFLSGMFILIAGFTCRYSKNNYVRGIKVFLFGVGITAVTVIFLPSQAIYFGILHFLGISMILFEAVKRWLDKGNRYFTLFYLSVIFILTFQMQRGFLTLPFWGRISLPKTVYRLWMAPFGLPGEGFVSSDYFPLLPWFSLFLIGSLIGSEVREMMIPERLCRQNSRILTWIGKRSLTIYLIHQPMIYAFLWLVLPSQS